MNKFTKLMEAKIYEFRVVDEDDSYEEITTIAIRCKHLVTVLLLAIALGLLQGCSPARISSGEPWRAKQVWRRITAQKDTTRPVRIGNWNFLPGTVEFILWSRIDSLEKRINILESRPISIYIDSQLIKGL